MPLRTIIALRRHRVAFVIVAILFLVAIALWWFWPVLVAPDCDSEAARTCATADDCRMESGYCCDVTNVYNRDAFPHCDESPSGHCQMVCPDVYRAVCNEGRCGYEVDREATRRHRERLDF